MREFFAAAVALPVPEEWPPTLTVVVDTEEEFDWSGPFGAAAPCVSNIAMQFLAQAVFDAHGVIPAYLVTHPVAADPAAAGVLRGFLRDGQCEIGAHLHTWVTPPHDGPTDRLLSFQGNLPPDLERRKLETLTHTIMAAFGIRPTMHKAGRYGAGAATAGILSGLGYCIDVSAVPGTDFSSSGGPDFSRCPPGPFIAEGGLMEIPMSVHFTGLLARSGPALFRFLDRPLARRLHLPGMAARSGLIERLRLTPEGHALPDLVRQVRTALANGTRLFMLTYHSSSLLPGAAPYVRTVDDRARFLETIAGFLRFFLGDVGGRACTVTAVAAALAKGVPGL